MKTTTNTPIIIKKESVSPYVNPQGKNQLCWDMMPRGLSANLSIGFDSMEPNACNGLGVHDTWDQVFILVAGSGTLVSGEKRIPIEAPSIVFIPKGTPHDVVTGADERIEYYYINSYDPVVTPIKPA